MRSFNFLLSTFQNNHQLIFNHKRKQLTLITKTSRIRSLTSGQWSVTSVEILTECSLLCDWEEEHIGSHKV